MSSNLHITLASRCAPFLSLQRQALREAVDAIPAAAVELEAGLLASITHAMCRLPGSPQSDALVARTPSGTAVPLTTNASGGGLTGRGAAAGPAPAGGATAAAGGPAASPAAAGQAAKGASGKAGKAGGGGAATAAAPEAQLREEQPLAVPTTWLQVGDPLLACGLPASEVSAATGAGMSAASAAVLQSELHEANVRLVAELWARAAQVCRRVYYVLCSTRATRRLSFVSAGGWRTCAQ